MDKIGALIQVRMFSSRLKNKALLNFEGYTAIERVINNLKPSKLINKIIISTSLDPKNKPIIDLCKKKNIFYFKGDEENVAQRLYDTAIHFGIEKILRYSGDDLLASYELADYIIKSHLLSKADYSGFIFNFLPIGVGTEIFNIKALGKVIKESKSLKYSEYLTFYFRNNPNIFNLNIVKGPLKYRKPKYRLTLDYPEDLLLFRHIFKFIGNNDQSLSLDKIINYLKINPNIAKINDKLPIKWQDDIKLKTDILKACII